MAAAARGALPSYRFCKTIASRSYSRFRFPSCLQGQYHFYKAPPTLSVSLNTLYSTHTPAPTSNSALQARSDTLVSYMTPALSTSATSSCPPGSHQITRPRTHTRTSCRHPGRSSIGVEVTQVRTRSRLSRFEEACSKACHSRASRLARRNISINVRLPSRLPTLNFLTVLPLLLGLRPAVSSS